MLRNTLSGCGIPRLCTSMYTPSVCPRPSRLARIYAVLTDCVGANLQPFSIAPMNKRETMYAPCTVRATP